MINRQELIPQYAKEYFQLGLRGYAFFSTELVRGCSDEERNRLLTLFGIEIQRLLRENREHRTVSDLPQKRKL